MNEESFGINPLSTQTELAITLAEIGTWDALVDHLDIAGLEMVRRRLKTTDMARICSSRNGAEIRAVTLDKVCRRLVELRPTMRDYYAADMLPEVPDDPANLGDGVA